MRRVLLLSAFLFCFAASVKAQSPKPASKAQAAPSDRRLRCIPGGRCRRRAPLSQNCPSPLKKTSGQTDARVKYTSRGARLQPVPHAGRSRLRTCAAERRPPHCDGLAKKINPDCAKSSDIRPRRILPLAENARARMLPPQVVGTEPLPGKINYYIGNDPSKWRTGVRQYGRVTYTRNLSRRGFDLLRKPAATGIGFRCCPRRKPPHRLNSKSKEPAKPASIRREISYWLRASEMCSCFAPGSIKRFMEHGAT